MMRMVGRTAVLGGLVAMIGCTAAEEVSQDRVVEADTSSAEVKPLTDSAAAITGEKIAQPSGASASTSDTPASTDSDSAETENTNAWPLSAEQILENIVAKQPQSDRLLVQCEYRVHRPEEDALRAGADRVWDQTIRVAAPDKYMMVMQERGDDEASVTYISNGQTEWTIEVEFADEDPIVSRKQVAGKNKSTVGWIADFFPLRAGPILNDFEIAKLDDRQGIMLVPKNVEMSENIKQVEIRADENGVIQSVTAEDQHDNRLEWTIIELEEDTESTEQTFEYE